VFGWIYRCGYMSVINIQCALCIFNGNFSLGVFLCGLIEVGLGARTLCCNWHSSFEN
jgi:hypothetical protein